MKHFLLYGCFLFLFSCDEKEDVINGLKGKDINIFNGITIEARKKENGKYIAYKFTRELGGEKFVLPNYKYYNNQQIANKELFDVARYGKANDISSFDEANYLARKYSDSINNAFESLRVYKIFSSDLQGQFIVFFLDKENFVAYVPDRSKVHGEFWKERFKSSKEIDRYWFSGKY